MPCNKPNVEPIALDSQNKVPKKLTPAVQSEQKDMANATWFVTWHDGLEVFLTSFLATAAVEILYLSPRETH